MFLLLLAVGMLIWGQTVLKTRLTGLSFVFYWLLCLLLTFLALATALVDLRLVRRRLRQEQKDLIQKTIEGVKADRQDKRRH
jgi:hypothetical protein